MHCCVESSKNKWSKCSCAFNYLLLCWFVAFCYLSVYCLIACIDTIRVHVCTLSSKNIIVIGCTLKTEFVCTVNCKQICISLTEVICWLTESYRLPISNLFSWTLLGLACDCLWLHVMGQFDWSVGADCDATSSPSQVQAEKQKKKACYFLASTSCDVTVRGHWLIKSPRFTGHVKSHTITAKSKHSPRNRFWNR